MSVNDKELNKFRGEGGSTAVAVVNADGSSVGGGTQYTDGATSPANPVGGIPVFDNAGTITAVSDTNPLPVDATFSGTIESAPTFKDDPTNAGETPKYGKRNSSTYKQQVEADVSGTVTANLGTVDNAVLDDIAANQTDASQKTQIVDGAGNVIGSTGNALDVNIASGSSSGTQYADADADATPTGTVAMGTDGSNVYAVHTDTSGDLQVDVLTMPEVAINDGGNVITVDGTVTANLSATDNGVLDQIELNTDDLLTTTDFNAAFGTAGSADSQVMSVQGIASMTPLLVDATGQGDVPITLDGEDVSVQGRHYTSTANSTTTPLTGDATFTGTGELISPYSVSHVSVVTDQDSATGGLSIQYSQDNTNWDVTETHTVTGGKPETIVSPHNGLYMRVVYTNGSTPQTYIRLQVMHHSIPIGAKIERIDGDIQDDHMAVTTKSVLMAKLPSGLYQTIDATTGGNLKVSVEEISDGLDVGAGAAGSETQRVILASDDPAVALLGTIDSDTSNLPTIETNTDFGTVVGGGTETGALRVTLANNSTGVISVDDNGSSLTVDNAGLTELASAINASRVDVNIAADSAGIGGGTQYAEDTAHTTGDTGTMALAVRDDTTPTAFSGTDGDYEPLHTDGSGNLWVSLGTKLDQTNDAITIYGSDDGGTTKRVIETDAGGAVAIQDGGNTITVDGTVAVTGVSTAANQTTIIGHVDGIEGLLTTIDADTGNLPTIETNTNFGTVTGGGTETGALRVTIANNSTGVVSIDDNGGAITVDGTVTANLSATDNAVLDQIELNQDSQTAILTTIDQDTGAIRTAVETLDNAISGSEMQVDVVAALPTGTNTIGAVNVKPATSGGLSIFRSLDLDETEEEVKGTAGQVFGWYLHNNASTVLYVKFYNATAASVTVGTTTPVMTIPVPAGSGANVEFTNGIAFSTAITVACTTGVADNDTTGAGANELVANILYK